ncbi:MAG: ATP-binding protein [Halodesulfovibrio sp.]
MPLNEQPPFFDRLAIRQGIIILAVALVLGLFSSVYIVAKEADSASKRLIDEVDTLLHVLSPSAAQASYNYDFAEAAIIVKSLLEFPIIRSASISNEVGEQLAKAEKPVSSVPISRFSRYLLDHLFMPLSEQTIHLRYGDTQENMGTLHISTDLTPLAEGLVRQHTLLFVYELSRAVVLALLLGLFFYHRMTKPLLGIATHVTNVDPQLPAISPVPIPPAHQHDELGDMIRNMNQLFAIFSETLLSKGKLEHSLLQMNTDLEQRVRERTQELQSQSEALRSEVISRALAESNLRAHHNLLDNLFEKMKAAIVIFNPVDREIIEINSVAEEMLEIDKGSPCHKGDSMDDSLAFIYASGIRKLCDYAASTPPYEEGTVRLPSGRTIPTAKYTFNMTVNGQPHVALILIDITEKKTLEHQLGIAQRLESIGLLASGIAHEINTPIQYIHDNMVFLKEVHTSQMQLNELHDQLCAKAAKLTELKDLCGQIQAASEEMDMDFARQELPRVFDMVFEGIERVVSIVSAMKRFAHSGPQGMVGTDLNAALLTTVQVAKNEWKYVAEVKTDFDPDIPPVECIPGEINQVFLNILINAAHAVKDVVGGTNTKGTITLSTRRDDGKVIVGFSDSGCGIPDSIRDKIFDQFFTTKDPGRGTGQGLAIVHNIVVKNHNGEIKVDSTVGKGTTFTIILPVSQPRQAPPSTAPAPSNA